MIVQLSLFVLLIVTRQASPNQVTHLPKICHEWLQLSSSSSHCFASAAVTVTTTPKWLTWSLLTATTAGQFLQPISEATRHLAGLCGTCTVGTKTTQPWKAP